MLFPSERRMSARILSRAISTLDLSLLRVLSCFHIFDEKYHTLVTAARKAKPIPKEIAASTMEKPALLLVVIDHRGYGHGCWTFSSTECVGDRDVHLSQGRVS